MANIKSAKKRIKVTEVKTARNSRVKAHVKAAIRDFDDAMAAADYAKAEEAFRVAEKKLMQASAKGSVNKHAAARKISRMATGLNKAKAEQ